MIFFQVKKREKALHIDLVSVESTVLVFHKNIQ